MAPSTTSLSVDERLALALQRFMIKGGESDCWEWTGEVAKGAPWATLYMHGRPNKRVSVRQYLWLQHGLEIARRDALTPTCGNVRCVNPAHMKHQARRCTVCAHAKRAEIDVLLKQQMISQGAVAERYGLSTPIVQAHWRTHTDEGRFGRATGKRHRAPLPRERLAAELQARAVALVDALLAGGPVASHVMYREARTAGLARHHVHHAYRVRQVRRFRPRGESCFWWRLPTDEETAATRLANQRTPSLYAKVPIKAGDVKRIVANKLTRRGARWSSVVLIKSWVGKPFHALALDSAEELHQQGSAEKLIDGSGKLKAYRMPPATPFDTRRDKRPVLHVMGGETVEEVDEAPAAAVTQMVKLIKEVLTARGRMSTNALHNHLGSSRRGSAAVFNAALHLMVEEGHAVRTVEGKTNFYEAVPTANQQASA